MLKRCDEISFIPPLKLRSIIEPHPSSPLPHPLPIPLPLIPSTLPLPTICAIKVWESDKIPLNSPTKPRSTVTPQITHPSQTNQTTLKQSEFTRGIGGGGAGRASWGEVTSLGGRIAYFNMRRRLWRSAIVAK